ncbi:MAG: EGF domain-containing protein [Polyangiales bacterium]
MAVTVFTMAVLGGLAGCRTPQESGERREVDLEAHYRDAGPTVATSCAQLTCAAPAECKVERGEARCACPNGFENNPDDPNACVDVDECKANTFECDTNASCQNRSGSYDCACKDGFSGNGKVCRSLNDCEGATNTCHADAMCSLGATDVSCECVAGFDGDGYSCQDIDECKTGSAECADNASCRNLRGRYECVCGPLFQGAPGEACQDACEIAANDPTRCDPGGRGRCVFASNGSARCTSCRADSTGTGQSCTASAACAALNCGENTVCNESAGSASCACAPGFSGDPSSGCTDVDECAGDNECDSAKSTCLNTPGGYTCTCKEGLERVDGECVNIDECERNLDLCDPGATCTDTPTGYECKCKAGYTGDGFSCKDVDECQEKTADCLDDGTASCQNKPGGYDCVCPDGYAGNAKSEACYCDLSGYWAVKQNSTLTLPERRAGSVVIIEGTQAKAVIWELHKYSYDGSVIKAEKRQCGTSAATEIFSPLYTETYSSFVPNAVYDTIDFQRTVDVPLAKNNALPGKPFVTPKDALVQGLRLADPINDPWPRSREDVPEDAWIDTDNDGEPGITLWPGQTTKMTTDERGTFSYLPVQLAGDSTRIETRTGCVSTAVRAVGHIEASIVSCNRLLGRSINDKTEGRVHSCAVLRQSDWEETDVTCERSKWNEARQCSPEQIAFLDDQDQTLMVDADFEAVKLGDLEATDIDCTTVREAMPAAP